MMWLGNKNIELRLYEMEPFSDEYTVLSTYEEFDVIDLLKSEFDIPDNSIIIINSMSARNFYTIKNDALNFDVQTEYIVNYTIIGHSYTNGLNQKVENLPLKMRDIKLNRLI